MTDEKLKENVTKHMWRFRIYAAMSNGAWCRLCNCELTTDNREEKCEGKKDANLDI